MSKKKISSQFFDLDIENPLGILFISAKQIVWCLGTFWIFGHTFK